MNDKLPQRPIQHVSEDTSKVIFRESIEKHWIFRDLGTNDYGIDFEVEIVSKEGEVSGNIVKVQLKGRDKIEFNELGRASVGGIKQSTLRYWLELSRSTPVFVAITDNSARRAYFVPVFWQAAAAIDGTQSTKSISFPRDLELGEYAGKAAFVASALEQPWERIRALEEILRELPALLHDYMWTYQADQWCKQERLDIYRRWIRNARNAIVPFSSDVEAELFDEQYWVDESERDWGDHIMYGTLRRAYTETFEITLPKLHTLVRRIHEARYYLDSQVPHVLRLIDENPLPSKYDIDSIWRFVDKHKILDPSE